MTNVNKINNKQKEVMAEFMTEHSNLAKNLLPNCSQGKVVAKRLWEDMSNRLNTYGPPIQSASLWRKVYADQKHNAKMKFSFNKQSKSKTGGGAYEEMLVSPVEEQIIEAAGIEAAAEGISSVKTFGRSKNIEETYDSETYTNETNANENNANETNAFFDYEDKDSGALGDIEKQTPRIKKQSSKLNLLMSNLSQSEKFHNDLSSKLDRLIEIKEKSLKLKEEEHIANMAIKKFELQIKTIEFENLKK